MYPDCILIHPSVHIYEAADGGEQKSVYKYKNPLRY